MKKLMICLAFAAFFIMAPMGAHAYMFYDSPSDAIGVPTFESYGINMYNYTPGVYSGAIYFDLFTNYPSDGLKVGDWNTQPADLFIRETYKGANYDWAIPLVDHDSFSAGTMYAVGTSYVSDYFEPAGGGYPYNHNFPVRIATLGNNYGHNFFGGGSVLWNNLGSPGSPDYMIRVNTGIWQDDPNGVYQLSWGTATCANDIISTPESSVLILLGLGLVGVVGIRRKLKS